MRGLIRSISIIACLALFSVSALGQGEVPSDWAVEEVNGAISQRAVPEELQSHYQTPIKRFEYVLLALELLKRNGDHVEIIEEHPFTDIDDHMYESEIIAAYNAGIIKGYGNGEFRPDLDITRQEIASLMVNLILRFDPYRDTFVSEEYTYDDNDMIPDWATGYINYCYDNGIMKGVGQGASGLDKIQPLGKATVEQAILMSYRLADAEGVFEKFQLGTVQIHQLTSEGLEIVESNIINEFSQNFGEGIGLKVKIISQDTAEIKAMSNINAEIKTSNTSHTTINFDGETIKITGRCSDVNDTQFYNTISYLMKAYGHQDEIDSLISSASSNFSEVGEYTKTIELDSSNRIKIIEDVQQDFNGENMITYWIIFEHEVFN